MLFAATLASTGVGSANGRLVPCPDAEFVGLDATIVAERPGTVIYEVRSDRASTFVAACNGSVAWVPRAPTRFG